MKNILIIFILTILISCKENADVDQFRTGTFKTFLDDSDVTSVVVRNDSIQIETYNNIEYTYAIEWKSNFKYVLTNLHPKNELDSTPFHIKITKFKDNSYNFKAYYKGSNFKQKGRTVKLK